MTRLFAILLLALAATPVSAEPVEVVVKLSAADLASNHSLRKRVAVAIEEICRSYSAVEPYQWPEIDSCRKAAWASAEPQISSLRGRNRIELSAK